MVSDRATHAEAFALIEDEGGPRSAGQHPLAQVMGDWLSRVVVMDGTPSLSLVPADVMLAHELLTQYQRRLAEETASVMEGSRPWRSR